MKTLKPFGLLLAVAVAGVLIGGCSGAGQPVQKVSGQSYQGLATDHLSAVVTVRSWFKILHQRTASYSYPNMEFLPDGSMRSWGTNSDGSQYEYLTLPDESGTGTQTRPDGNQIQMQWGAPVWEGDRGSYHVTETLWTGGSLDYDFVIDFSVPTSLQIWDGHAELPNNPRMNFRLEREQDVDDKLWIEFPDGATLSVSVRTGPTEGTIYWPAFDTGAVGTFTGPTGRQLAFTMLGDNAAEQWETWTFQGSDGSAGTFSLGADLPGSGTLRMGGDVIGALNWQAGALAGKLDLVASDSTEVAASAAARDFQIDRWITNMAAMGPAPMY